MTPQIPSFIANEPVIGEGPEYSLVSPVDGSVTATVREASEAQVQAAVKAAKDALCGPWGQMTVERRMELLHAVAAEINRRVTEFALAEMTDTGQPRPVMEKVFVPRGAANFRFFADLFKNLATETFEMNAEHGRSLNYQLRRPKGVIAVICPWNAPLMLMTWKVGPALAAGNTVVVKPSEQTPRSAALLGEVMRDVGIPDGVFNVVHGFGPGSAGAFLTSNPDVDGITFTGETTTGTAIMQAAAVGIRDISMELGGKNSAVVCADADLDAAVAGVFRSTFLNTGQVCLGTERVFVERSIYETFKERLIARAEKVAYGRPTDAGTSFGPLISLEHREKVLSYYQKAVEEGATVLTGGGVPELPQDLAGGSWVQPTIWEGAPWEASINHEEIFGPCCHLVPFDSDAEVLAKVNDTPYGLAASVWTGSLSRAHDLAAGIDVGIVWVNSWYLRDLRTAFGGAKQSGIGREGGVHSLEFYTETKNVCVQL